MAKRFSKNYGNKGSTFNYLQSKKGCVRCLSALVSLVRLSRSKESVWSNCILRFVQACQEILGMLIGLSTAVTYCGFPPRARESGAREITQQQP